MLRVIVMHGENGLDYYENIKSIEPYKSGARLIQKNEKSIIISQFVRIVVKVQEHEYQD